MKTIQRVLAIFVAVISIFALITAALGGAIVESLVAIFSLGQATAANAYPLGAGVFAVYACGFGLAAFALRRPVAAAAAMLPLGVVAFLFGGPIAKAFGIAIVCAGAILLATSLRRNPG